MSALVPGILGLMSFVATPAAAQIPPCETCPDDVSFTPSSCVTPVVEKAWGGRFYSSIHRFDGTDHHLWVGEDGGRISHSINGGVDWTSQPVPVGITGEVRGLYFLDDALHGWAVTSDGWVLKTDDGGASCWEQLSFIEECDDEGASLFDVFFFDGSNGFLGGENVLMRTSNGGTSWVGEDVDTSEFSMCIANAPEVEVYAFAVVGTLTDFMAVTATEPGDILFRTDTQTEWQVALELPDENGPCPGQHVIESWDIEIAPGATTAEAVVYLAVGQGNPCGTVFRGVYDTQATELWTWQEEFHECVVDSPPCRVTEPDTEDMLGCPIEGAGVGKFKSLYAIYAFDEDLAIAVGYGAGIFYRDAGPPVKWIDITDQQYFSTAPLGTIVGNDVDTAWIFGEFGDMRMLDLGALAPFLADDPIQDPPPARPFTALAPQTGWRLKDLWFSSETTGWGVGQIGRIVRWDETDSTWVHVRSACLADPLSTDPMESIVFATSNIGVAVGGLVHMDNVAPFDGQADTHTPQIYVTTNGGQTAGNWTQLLHTGTPEALYDVAHRPSTLPAEFWAVGDNGLVLRIRKTGPTAPYTLTTITGPSGSGNLLRAIEFVNSTTAVVVGSNGTAGKAWKLDVSTSTWTDVTPSGGAPLLKDVATVGTKAWAVGAPGTSEATVLFSANITTTSFSLADTPDELDDANLAAIDAIAAGGGVTEILIGGLDGVLLQGSYDGTSTDWDVLDSDTAKHLTGVSLPAPGKGWLMGSPVVFENNDSITLRFP